MIRRMILTLLASIVVTSCAGMSAMDESCPDPKPGRTEKPFLIKLKVAENNAGDKYLEVDEGPQCGGGSGNKGCAYVPENQAGKFTFLLIQGNHQDCSAKGLDWRLDGIELSEELDKDLSDTVSQRVQCDFGTDVEGQVLNPSFNANKMIVEDHNMNPVTQPYIVWYTVTAVSCKDEKEKISTDPWIENRGTS